MNHYYDNRKIIKDYIVDKWTLKKLFTPYGEDNITKDTRSYTTIIWGAKAHVMLRSN
jgi:hypothetical protein